MKEVAIGLPTSSVVEGCANSIGREGFPLAIWAIPLTVSGLVTGPTTSVGPVPVSRSSCCVRSCRCIAAVEGHDQKSVRTEAQFVADSLVPSV